MCIANQSFCIVSEYMNICSTRHGNNQHSVGWNYFIYYAGITITCILLVELADSVTRNFQAYFFLL